MEDFCPLSKTFIFSVYVLSSSLVAKYIEARSMENQEQFRKTTVGYIHEQRASELDGHQLHEFWITVDRI